MPAAFRAHAALCDLGKIMILCLRAVPLHTKPRIMMFLNIPAAGKIHSTLQRVIIKDREIPLQTKRPNKSRMQAGFLCEIVTRDKQVQKKTVLKDVEVRL